MSQNQIKWLATLLMVIDHVGFVIESEPMRIIGRLSFPLFAWVFAQNWKRREPDSSAKPLMTRLALFGLIAQFPHILLFRNHDANILISLGITVGIFIEIHKSQQKLLYLIGGMIIAQGLHVSYGWYAVVCPLLMINLKGANSRMWWIWWIIINVIYTITCQYPLQIFAIVAPIILAYHNPAKDRKPTTIEKSFFYYFYPIHLAGLAAMRTLL
jgi:hypothetical protein